MFTGIFIIQRYHTMTISLILRFVIFSAYWRVFFLIKWKILQNKDKTFSKYIYFEDIM